MLNENYELEYNNRYLTKDQKNYIAEQLENVCELLDSDYSLEGYGNITNISSIGYSGFIPFTDGGLTLNYDVRPFYLLGSGYSVKCIEHYNKVMEQYAIEFAEETTSYEENEDLYYELKDEYMSDIEITMQCRIQFYHAEHDGNGTNKLYGYVALVDEYDRILNDDKWQTHLKDYQQEIEFVNINEFNTHVDTLIKMIKKGIEQ